jgi:hypothetical protein
MSIKIKTSIELGWRVKDTITGFEGIAIAIAAAVFLNGCERIAIQPEGLKDGKLLEYFDTQQLVVIDKKPQRHAPPVSKKDKPGGPQSAPSRQADPPK